MIRVNRKDLIKRLGTIDADNVSIAGIGIYRKTLLEALKLQNQDEIKISYGSLGWQYHYEMAHIRGKPTECQWDSEPYIKEPEPCVQFSCDHTVMRFFDRPGGKTKGFIDPVPLAFVDNIETLEAKGIPLDTKSLLDALYFAQVNLATDTSRPVLQCIYFECGDDKIIMTAADGHRLGSTSIPAKGIDKQAFLIYDFEVSRLFKFLKAIKPIGKGKAKYMPEVYMTLSKKNITLSSGTDTIELSKAEKMVFPAYRQLIPEGGTKVEFVASDLLQSLKAVTGISEAGIIKLQFKQYDKTGKIVLSGHMTDYEGDSEATAECECKPIESDCKTAVNAKYLRELLSLCKDKLVTAYVKSPSDPIRFDCGDGNLAIIMPMSVQW